MNEKLNHTCIICGTKYHACDTCATISRITPWKRIVDTPNHYKIYLILNDYNYGIIKKQEAKRQLAQCDLINYKTFNKDVVAVIDTILESNLKQKEKSLDVEQE